jgi:vancomycin aglycone glucosyltransferase
MNILMSTIGSRGDVQPLLALGQQLKTLGHRVSLCAAPNFGPWVESHGFGFQPIGPDLKELATKFPSSKPPRPTRARRIQLAEHTVRDQFRVLGEAARGSDLLIGGGALQLALRSLGEALRIPYVYVAYCPATIPSRDHPPARMGVHYPQWLPAVANRLLWRRDARSFNDIFARPLNEERTKRGLEPVANVQPYIFTHRPWLATDPILGPAPVSRGGNVVQTGAWLLRDDTPLPAEVERFLNEGDPPLYLGFGSMRAEPDTGSMLVQAAKKLGRRSILLEGWANLSASEVGGDCLVIDDVNHERLLPRVAAIVHHGGAGTTHAAARAGRPQVIVPHHYDQFYWAHRIETLGVGVSHRSRQRLTADRLAESLRRSLRPAVEQRAAVLATRMTLDGAYQAAVRLGHELQ